jgi:hypothetical protein
MAADPTGTPEAIALHLMNLVASVEQKDFNPQASQGKTTPDRAWILQTYAECLNCVRHPKMRSSHS